MAKKSKREEERERLERSHAAVRQLVSGEMAQYHEALIALGSLGTKPTTSKERAAAMHEGRRLMLSTHVPRAKRLPSRELRCWCGWEMVPHLGTTAMTCCSAECVLRLKMMRCSTCGGDVNRHDVLLDEERPRCWACRRDARWEFPEAFDKQHLKRMRSAIDALLVGLSEADVVVLAEAVEHDPRDVYRGLLTVVLRVVFLAYAEDTDLLDVGFRDLVDSTSRGTNSVPSWQRFLEICHDVHADRGGGLFDPERYPFLHLNAGYGAFQLVLRLILETEDGRPLNLSRLGVEHVFGRYDELMGGEIVRDDGVFRIVRGKERKDRGAYYTPRELTEPTVRKTLEPIMAVLGGDQASSESILSLHVLDPACGAGAFLVELCRQLGDLVVRAWLREGRVVVSFSSQDSVADLARRAVAVRCVYGVDKDPFATELSRMAMWVVARAAGEPFTFVNHAIRTGDSLVGLDNEQIKAFNWVPIEHMAETQEAAS